MTNFYRDNSDIQFHIKNMDFSKIVPLIEDDFTDIEQYPYAPNSVEDARENYDKVLEIVGEIAGDFVAPRSGEVDEVGAIYQDGKVIYAPGTLEALDRINKADLAGFVLQRKYGGLNMPLTIFSAAIEVISRADASLMLIFGLQGLARTLEKFGNDEQKNRILPRFASGDVVGSMALTEPDSGSDLQSVMLKATEDENGKWRLNGVKRFITTGCAEVSLVLARSEEGSTSGKGLSMFLYERDKDMKIRRIEHKLGIKGSPTCELQFNNAEAELVAKRKFGLVKYTMFLMNSARLAVAAQSVGIAEAAYREANSYAKDRFQFKKSIREIPAVYELLTDMKVRIEGSRTLLYETSRLVDVKEGIEKKLEWHPELKKEMKEELTKYTKLAALFTPMIKAYASEMANRVCYDAIQVHAGVGFTKEFKVERHYRDARITSIYEGTTQLQYLAAMGGIIGGGIFDRISDYEANHDFSSLADLHANLRKMSGQLKETVAYVKEKDDSSYQEHHTERLVNMTIDIVISYLLTMDAIKSDRKKKVAKLFILKAQHQVKAAMERITSGDDSLIKFHSDVLDTEELV